MSLAFVDSVGYVYDTISDAFGRTSASGWGSTDTGQAWTSVGGSASDHTVSSGTGRHVQSSADVPLADLVDTSAPDQVVTATVAFPVASATTGPLNVHVLARYADATHFYGAMLSLSTAGQLDLIFTYNQFGTGIFISTLDASYGANETWKVKIATVGDRVSIKAWAAASTEPTAWTFEIYDTNVTAGNYAGVASYRDPANTNSVTFQFNDFEVTSPTQVRLDLDDTVTWSLQRDETDFGMPRLRRAVAGTLLADGQTYPSAAYENRELTLRLALAPSDRDTAASRMQALWRELDRPTNILRWQRGSSSQPVFFRTFRANPDQLLEVPRDDARYETDVVIPAEPFALGLPVFGTAVVDSDPAETNGLRFDLASVHGDVETPLYLRLLRGFNAGSAAMVGVRRRPLADQAPFLLQAESMTGGTNTTVQANDSTMSGSGSNFMRCTFGTPTMTARLTKTGYPSTVGPGTRGTYRVLARVQFSAAGTYQIQRTTGDATILDAGPVITLTPSGATATLWVDLGLMSWPYAQDPVEDGLSGRELPVSGRTVVISAARTSGSGNLDFDCLLFVPADDRLAVLDMSGVAASNVTLDPHRGMAYWRSTDGSLLHYEIQSAKAVRVSGGLPYVTPDATNRLVIVFNVALNAQADPDDITASSAVAYYYWPRYLYVRPAAS